MALKDGQPTELNKRILQTGHYVIRGDRQCSSIILHYFSSIIHYFSCNFNSMSGNKLPTGFIQIKLTLGLNSYDEMQLYDR